MDAEGGTFSTDLEGTAVKFADFLTTWQQRATKLILACQQNFGTLL